MDDVTAAKNKLEMLIQQCESCISTFRQVLAEFETQFSIIKDSYNTLKENDDAKTKKPNDASVQNTLDSLFPNLIYTTGLDDVVDKENFPSLPTSSKSQKLKPKSSKVKKLVLKDMVPYPKSYIIKELESQNIKASNVYILNEYNVQLENLSHQPLIVTFQNNQSWQLAKNLTVMWTCNIRFYEYENKYSQYEWTELQEKHPKVNETTCQLQKLVLKNCHRNKKEVYDYLKNNGYYVFDVSTMSIKGNNRNDNYFPPHIVTFLPFQDIALVKRNSLVLDHIVKWEEYTIAPSFRFTFKFK